VIRNGLRWRDAPAVYGPHKTLYNRFVRWSRMGIFDRIFALAAESGPLDSVMIDSTHLKAHRTAVAFLSIQGSIFGACPGHILLLLLGGPSSAPLRCS
jgi:transposase